MAKRMIMENKRFTLKQMFSIVDGRLSTGMDDVYVILNIAANESLTTIALPIVMDLVTKNRPDWYVEALTDLNIIKATIGNDFETLMKHLNTVKNTYEVSPMKSAVAKKG